MGVRVGVPVGGALNKLIAGIVGKDGSVGIEVHQPFFEASSPSTVEVEKMGEVIFLFSFTFA